MQDEHYYLTAFLGIALAISVLTNLCTLHTIGRLWHENKRLAKEKEDARGEEEDSQV